MNLLCLYRSIDIPFRETSVVLEQMFPISLDTEMSKTVFKRGTQLAPARAPDAAAVPRPEHATATDKPSAD